MFEKDLFDEIARMAYELWEKNGCIHGRDIEHWCEAESIIISRMEIIPEEKPKKAGTPKKATGKTTKKTSSKATKKTKTSGSAKKA